MATIIKVKKLLEKNNITIIKYCLVNAKEFLLNIIKMSETEALEFIEDSPIKINYKDDYYFHICVANMLYQELNNEKKIKLLEEDTSQDENKIYEFTWNNKKIRVVKNKEKGMYFNKKDIFDIIEINIDDELSNKMIKKDEKKLGDLISNNVPLENCKKNSKGQKENRNDDYICCLDLFTIMQFSKINNQKKLINFIIYHIQFEVNNDNNFYNMIELNVLFSCCRKNKKEVRVIDYFKKQVAYVASVGKNQIVINHTKDILEDLKLKTKIYKKFDIFFIKESDDPEKIVELFKNKLSMHNY